jgi:hypothetical protein
MSSAPRKVLLGLLLGAVILAGVDFVGRQRTRSAVRRCKATLVASGEKLSIDELDPRPSAEALASFNALLQAAAQLRDRPNAQGRIPAAMKPISPGRARVAWKQPELKELGPSGTWAQVAEDLANNREALRQVRAALRQPAFGLALDYHQGFDLLLPHIAKLKTVSQRLSMATLDDLHDGQLDAAAANLEALLTVPETLREEPVVISQLVRIAVAAIAFNATWEALQADGWSDEQLASFQRHCETIEFMAPVQRALEMERALALDTFERVRRSPALQRRLVLGSEDGSGGPVWPAAPGELSSLPGFLLQAGETAVAACSEQTSERLWRWRWSYVDELKYLQVQAVLLQMPRQVRAGTAFVPARQRCSNELARGWTREQASSRKYRLTALLVPSLEKFVTRGAQLEVQRELTLAAIALKRHALRHPVPPPSLSVLVPDYLRRVPRDFMDGRELRYRVLPDATWILYSVGEDGVDDGGDPRPRDLTSPSKYFGQGRDIVWPRPATAEEISREESKDPPSNSAAAAMLKRYGLTPAK